MILLERSRILIDVDGAFADRLTINGGLNLNQADDSLLINVLGSPTQAQYVLASWTGALEGVFDNVSGVPDGYELQYASNQLLLVSIPEPTAIAGLAILAGALTRRRRTH